jgi:pilus assembly protein CpaC
VFRAPGVDRITVGKADMLSSTVLNNGEIVIIAEAAGETTMQIWFKNGKRENMRLNIVETNGWREAMEIKQILKDMPGVKVSTIGRRVVVDGRLRSRDLEKLKTLKERYADILVLATPIVTTDEINAVKSLVRGIAGLEVKVVDEELVLDGVIQDRDVERIKMVQSLYPDIKVLTTTTSAFEEKMIYFDVRVTEFAKDYTEKLGIDWNTNIRGPIFNYGNNIAQGGAATPDFSGNSTVGAFDNFATDVTGSATYFGIATEITSMIDLLEQNGSAVTLANPRMSARSGGTADLTVGGEVPVVTSSLSGANVEYKDYGILLNIEPKLDMYENIAARVGVSISQLDVANAVDGQPAFKKRSTTNDVSLKAGQTLVLSGLLTREDQKTVKKVKWLADIPILGSLFRSESFIKNETELVIFITPTVMDKLDSGANAKDIAKADEMLEMLENDEIMGLAH